MVVMWREWIEDESRIASTKEEKQRVIQLYSKAVEDYLCKLLNIIPFLFCHHHFGFNS